MSKAPNGAIVSLYYDSPRDVDVGHYLQTPTGRCYQMIGVRRQTKGMHVGRWHLTALVVDAPPPGATVHPIYWYRRKARKGIA